MDLRTSQKKMNERFKIMHIKFRKLEIKLDNTSLNNQQKKLLDDIKGRIKKLGDQLGTAKILRDPKTGKYAGIQVIPLKVSLPYVIKECDEIEKMVDLLPIKKQRSAKIDRLNKIFKNPQQNNDTD